MIRRRGYTLVEVLVALVILLAGVVGIIQLFPVSLEGNREAELKGAAATLAQAKVAELRRDHDELARVIEDVRSLTVPTDPVAWPFDDRLTYSFCGVSLLAEGDTPGDPRDDEGVARVIVRLNRDFDPSERVLYELRFDE